MRIDRETPERTGANVRQLERILTLLLCIVLLGQMQPAVAACQEPQVPTQQSQQDMRLAAAPVSARTAEPAAKDPIPAAPVPMLALLSQQSQASSSQQQPSAPPDQQSTPPQQPVPQRPVGTAAAPYEKPVGVPGSRPAGAAIAPAKQRRVRAIVIRVGLILAGAGAVGAVVGLSKASHSQP